MDATHATRRTLNNTLPFTVVSTHAAFRSIPSSLAAHIALLRNAASPARPPKRPRQRWSAGVHAHGRRGQSIWHIIDNKQCEQNLLRYTRQQCPHINDTKRASQTSATPPKANNLSVNQYTKTHTPSVLNLRAARAHGRRRRRRLVLPRQQLRLHLVERVLWLPHIFHRNEQPDAWARPGEGSRLPLCDARAPRVPYSRMRLATGSTA